MQKKLLNYCLKKRMIRMIKSDILDIVNKCYRYCNLSHPVNLYDLSEKLDIKVFKADLDSEGYFLNKNGKLYILLNKNCINENRQRFTFAHEIGHAILHSNSSIIKSNVNRTLIFNYPKELDTVEKQANFFASELLCPSSHLKNEMPNTSINFKIVDYVADKYLISRQMAAIKCVFNSKTENELLLFYDDNNEIKWFVSNDAELKYSELPNDVREVNSFLEHYFDKDLVSEEYTVESYGTTILASGKIQYNYY